MNLIERTVSNATTWFNDRAPGFMPFYKKHMTEYYAPKNFNLLVLLRRRWPCWCWSTRS